MKCVLEFDMLLYAITVSHLVCYDIFVYFSAPLNVVNLCIFQDSKINTMTTDDTEDSDVHSGTLLYPMKDSLRLLDAHLIFEPLLSSLSVMPQQMLSAIGSGNVNNVSSLDSLGSNLSLVGSMETMRIDIVVSEFGKLTDKKKGIKKNV